MVTKSHILNKALDRASKEVRSRPDWMKPVRLQDGNVRQGLYRHFKGNLCLYLVHGVAVNSETGEREVVYRPLFNSHELMTRSEKMFLEEVDRPEFNYKGPRFIFVKEMS